MYREENLMMRIFGSNKLFLHNINCNIHILLFLEQLEQSAKRVMLMFKVKDGFIASSEIQLIDRPRRKNYMVE